MVDKIKVKNTEAFEKLIEEKDLRISKSIVKGILENLVGKRKHIPVLEVYLEEEGTIVDITCDRKDFIATLEENLKIHEYHEKYEACAGIGKAINFLKN